MIDFADVSDVPTRRNLALLHPALREEAARTFIETVKNLQGKNGWRCTYSWRSCAAQDDLFAKGRERINGIWRVINKRAIVTNAQGGQSYHNYGLALDFCLIHPDKRASWNTIEDLDGDGIADWMEIVAAFQGIGWEWGGTWNRLKDRPHLQKTFGHHWRELGQMVRNGQVDEDGYVRIMQ